jgi:1-pyrroline-4-hydroxy-2-carboxylate deaminase
MARARWGWIVGAAFAVTALVLSPSQTDAGGPCACTGPWAGIYPLVLLPYGCGCDVDEAALEAQLRYQLAGGVSGVVILGTIGEGELAAPAVRAQMIQATARIVNGCVPIIVGIHTCDLEMAKAQMLQARELGAAAVLVKYKGNPRANGCQVLAFYQWLSDLAILPIFYYHYPNDTGLKLTPEQLACIVRLPGVVGAKISTLDLREFEELVARTRGCGKVFHTATALNLTQFLDAGGHGAMCPEATVLPGLTVCAYRLYCEGRAATARDVQKELFVLAPILRGGLATEGLARRKLMISQDLGLSMPVRDSHPQARLKATLNGLCVRMSNRVSCPLPDLSRHDQALVDGVVAKIRDRQLIRNWR